MKTRRIVRLLTLSLLCLALQGFHSTSSFAATGDADTYLSLNGTSQYGSVPEGSAYVARGTYSIEAWINPSSLTCSLSGNTYCTIMSHDGDYALIIADGKLQTYMYYNGTGTNVRVDSSQLLVANTWQHVALVRNGASVAMYVNGDTVTSTSISGYTGPSTYPAGTYPLKIGWQYGNQYFTGGIDEVRVYSRALSQTQVRSDMNTWGPANATGLVGYYDFNDISSGVATNKVSGSTSATDLTLTGSPVATAIESTTVSGGYKTVTFTRSYISANGGYIVPDGVSTLSTLVVGGGGGGGMDGGGGGGGGGVYENSAVTITPNTNIDIDVGGGGTAGTQYEPAPACITPWQNGYPNVGCKGGDGSASRFGSYSAGGGGGAGGIENSGNDAPTGFTARGSGGGVGAQNTKSGTGTPGAGTFSGGTVSDNSANTSGSGGGGFTAAGGNGSANTSGDGGSGYTASLTGLIYGAGGAGGTFGGSTAATGGGNSNSGAANGGNSTNQPTYPVINRGGGGGGGGNGSPTPTGLTVSNAYGTPGAGGVVILRWALKGSVSFTVSGTPTFRSVSNLVATTNTASKVTFFANGKKIPGCVSLATSNNSVTCPWKPSTHSGVTITVKAVPTDTNYASVSLAPTNVSIVARSGKR